MAIVTREETPLPKPNYKYITNEEDARSAMSFLDRYDSIAIDTEATSLDPFEAKWSLLQMGVPDHAFVFDVRHDTEHSSLHPEVLDPLLKDARKLKLLQNANYDMKLIKLNRGFYLSNVYDTMLAEQLSYLGLHTRANLEALVFKYLGLALPKEPRTTFTIYDQVFEPFQLEYAANDVVTLHHIRDCQLIRIQKENLARALDLELRFLIPLCEMELNGILIDVEKWRLIMKDVERERDELRHVVHNILDEVEDQSTLFGGSVVNIDSNQQLGKVLAKFGLEIPNTSVGSLNKYKGVPIVDAVLDYRKANKLISTYAEPLLERISKYTGRLHTDFRQIVSTGRLSSSNPNLQNIPKHQKYRSCFIAKLGYSLITADMSGAELRIMGNLSADPVFIEAYATGQDLHTRTAAEMFGVAYDKVVKSQRNAAKAINFGLMYGMSAVGLAARIGVNKKEAENLMERYFSAYKGVKSFLDKAGRDAVMNRYSTTISGRRRYYSMPPYDHPDRNKIQRGIERQGKNAPVQGSNADTIKEAMIILVDAIKAYDARLVLSVHDEVVVEVVEEQKCEVIKVVEQSIIDGFGKYFSLIPMEADALLGPTWLKGGCENKVDGKKCGGNEMKLIPHPRLKTQLVCSKCGAKQD